MPAQLVFVAFCSYAFAIPILEDKLQASDIEESAAGHIIFATLHEGGYGGNIDFTQGSSLRAIAQNSAELANTAIVNHHTASNQAEFTAKNELAHTAIGASATATAALIGKQILLQRLEQEFQNAQEQLESATLQLEQAQRAALAAQNLVHLAQSQLSSIAAAVNAAHGTVLYATEAANTATAEVGSQLSMVGEAKSKIESIAAQLDLARTDYEATEAATYQASKSVELAQSSAQNAAEKISSNNVDVGIINGLSILPTHFGPH
ncbi:hypothetical protein Trydic_g13885 [Trypoxylus dichotomus]